MALTNKQLDEIESWSPAKRHAIIQRAELKEDFNVDIEKAGVGSMAHVPAGMEQIGAGATPEEKSTFLSAYMSRLHGPLGHKARNRLDSESINTIIGMGINPDTGAPLHQSALGTFGRGVADQLGNIAEGVAKFPNLASSAINAVTGTHIPLYGQHWRGFPGPQYTQYPGAESAARNLTNVGALVGSMFTGAGEAGLAERLGVRGLAEAAASKGKTVADLITSRFGGIPSAVQTIGRGAGALGKQAAAGGAIAGVAGGMPGVMPAAPGTKYAMENLGVPAATQLSDVGLGAVSGLIGGTVAAPLMRAGTTVARAVSNKAREAGTSVLNAIHTLGLQHSPDVNLLLGLPKAWSSRLWTKGAGNIIHGREGEIKNALEEKYNDILKETGKGDEALPQTIAENIKGAYRNVKNEVRTHYNNFKTLAGHIPFNATATQKALGEAETLSKRSGAFKGLADDVDFLKTDPAYVNSVGQGSDKPFSNLTDADELRKSVGGMLRDARRDNDGKTIGTYGKLYDAINDDMGSSLDTHGLTNPEDAQLATNELAMGRQKTRDIIKPLENNESIKRLFSKRIDEDSAAVEPIVRNLVHPMKQEGSLALTQTLRQSPVNQDLRHKINQGLGAYALKPGAAEKGVVKGMNNYAKLTAAQKKLFFSDGQNARLGAIQNLFKHSPQLKKGGVEAETGFALTHLLGPGGAMTAGGLMAHGLAHGVLGGVGGAAVGYGAHKIAGHVAGNLATNPARLEAAIKGLPFDHLTARLGRYGGYLLHALTTRALPARLAHDPAVNYKYNLGNL